jgi:elongation factor Ts
VAISAAAVKALREKTGAGMMDCKRALNEAEGDEAKAIRILREKGIASAHKKSSRAANEGMVATEITEDGSAGVLVEVNCETDFVARTPQFQEMVARVARHIACCVDPPDCVSQEEDASGKSPLLEQPLTDDPNTTVEGLVKAAIGELGENMRVRRFARFTDGKIVAYIHPGSRIGSMLEIEADPAVVEKPEFAELGKDLAMQVAGHLPPARCVQRDELPEAEIESEKEVYAQQARNEGKPEKIIDKIVQGKLKNFFKQVVLTEQVFIKDTSISVKKLLDTKAGELGGPITIRRIARFQVGEEG